MATDLFSTRSVDSIVRQALKAKGPTRLSDYNIQVFATPPADYKFWPIRPDQHLEDSAKEPIEVIMHDTSHLRRVMENKTQDPRFSRQAHAALLEACKNAYEHGNLLDPSKSVNLWYRICPRLVDFVVVDEGGLLHPDFAPFVLEHRHKKSRDELRKPIGFYEFSEQPVPQGHSGVGTSVMHMYCDEVRYYKDTGGGLAVQLIKKMPSKGKP